MLEKIKIPGLRHCSKKVLFTNAFTTADISEFVHWLVCVGGIVYTLYRQQLLSRKHRSRRFSFGVYGKPSITSLPRAEEH